MWIRLKRLAILIAGWAFVLLGIVGIFLPFLQGILFMLVGLILLSTEYLWAQRLLGKIRARFPKLQLKLEKAADYANLWLRRIKRLVREEKNAKNPDGQTQAGSEPQGKKEGS